MQRYYEALIDSDSGAALPGYYARLTDPVTLGVAPMYADRAGTPIETVSGVANMAQAGGAGNIAFFYPDGFYHVDIYAPDATTFLRRYTFIGSDIQNANGTYTPTLTGAVVPGALTGTISGVVSLNGSLASVAINAAWSAHTGNGHTTFSLPTAVGATGITADPSAPAIIPCEVSGEGFVGSANTILTAIVNPANNRIRLWEQSIGNGSTAVTRTAFLLPGAGSIYLFARYPVIRT